MSEPRIRPLTAADLVALPDPCPHCTFGPSSSSAWARSVSERWGYCGVQARVDGVVIGFLTFAPADEVPRTGAYAATPVSLDAAAVLSVRVSDGHRGVGVGRQLVQAAAALMLRREVRALEAVGSHRSETACVPPVGWLEAVGFVTVRAHPVSPRLRMSLQNTRRWPDLGAAWHRLTDLVQPAPEPRGVSWRKTSPAGLVSAGSGAGRGAS